MRAQKHPSGVDGYPKAHVISWMIHKLGLSELVALVSAGKSMKMP